MATNTLEFTLKDGSQQILDLSVLANILYIDLYMEDGTVLQVPLRFLQLSTGDEASLANILTAIITANMENENVMREMGYRMTDAMVAPFYADDRALEKLKFTKTLEYNIRGRSDEIIELVSGSLPKGISLVKSGDTYKIEGYAHEDNFEKTTVEDFERLHMQRQLEFLNIKYTKSSDSSQVFNVGDIVVDQETKSFASIAKIERYLVGDENRTKFIINEFHSETEILTFGDAEIEIPTQFDYYNGRVTFDDNMNPIIKDEWRGSFSSTDDQISVTFEEVNQVMPEEITSKHEKDYEFTLGLRTPESSEYIDTNDYKLKLRQNFDSVRDKLLPLEELPVQKEFDVVTGDAYVYYAGDTNKFVPAATWYLPFKKTTGESANIPLTSGFIKYGETTIDARLGFMLKTNTGVSREIELL